MLGREQASFWRENVVAVVIPLRVLASAVVARTRNQMLESFIILPSGEALTSFNNDNSAILSGEKSTMKNSGVSIF